MPALVYVPIVALLIGLALLVLLPLLLVLGALRLLRGPSPGQRQRRAMQETVEAIRQGTGRMGKRVEALETILLPEARADKERRS